jgi:hypothetical protein
MTFSRLCSNLTRTLGSRNRFRCSYTSADAVWTIVRARFRRHFGRTRREKTRRGGRRKETQAASSREVQPILRRVLTLIVPDWKPEAAC